jgi:predicted kinase
VSDSKLGEILILSGPPGAGKTTIALALADSCEVSAVHLHSDDFWHFIKRGWIAPYLPESDAQNQVVIDAICAAARVYAKGRYFVVIDGIFGTATVTGRIQRAIEVTVHYIVLRPDMRIALDRARQRKSKDFKDPAILRGLYKKFADLGDFEPHALDTSAQSVGETLKAVREALAAGRFRLPAMP